MRSSGRLFFRPLLVGGALASTLLVAACGQRPSNTPAAAPTPVPASPVTAQTATRGVIQQTLSYSGDIRAREQVSVLPKNSGRVAKMLVDVGSHVKAGDTIAVLEQDSAQISALQARATLAGAEAKLASVQTGAKADDVAAAEAALIQQQVHLQSMQSGGRAEDIQVAQAALDAQQAKLDLMVQGGRPEAIQQAQDALDSANAKLTAVEKGATNDVIQAAQSAVDSDRSALASAEAAYAALGGNNAADLQSAQSQVDTLAAGVQAAQAAVASADAALSNLQGTAPADIQQAQTAFDQAQSGLKSAQAALTQGYNPTQASVAQAQAAVQQAQAGLQSAESQQTSLEQGVAAPCADTTVAPGVTINKNSTACGQAKAAADASVQSANAAVESAQGQLDLLKRGGSPAQQAQLQSAVDQAQSSVSATKLRLDAVKNGGIDAQRAQLQAAREQAQSQFLSGQQNLVVAQARLKAINNGTQDAQVKSASSQVTAAGERLKSDQAKLDQLNAGPTDEDLQQAQSAVDQAAQQLTLAIQPSTDQDIRAQRASVEQARLQLRKAALPYTDYDIQQQQQAVAQAEANLRTHQNPYTDQDLASAQAVVDESKAQLDLADIGVKDTTIVAPADGAISERLVSPGALVSPTTPIVTLVPPALELVVNVEERQLGQVAEGQSVQLSVPAFPQQTFTGSVKSISPTVDSKSRTAAVRIEPQDDASKLRAGMFAQLSIVTAEKQNALIVPKQAVLTGTPGVEPLVITIDPSGRVHRQPVQLGLQSDTATEILSGIDDGQLVATSSLSDLTDGDIVAPQVDTRTAMR
jgi:RND family efflux transporter MFP subunit